MFLEQAMTVTLFLPPLLLPRLHLHQNHTPALAAVEEHPEAVEAAAMVAEEVVHQMTWRK